MYIKATIQPDSRADSVSVKNGRYIIATREQAKEGRANAAARTLLARHLGIPEKSLSLLRGADKPSKLFLLLS
jgi:uncharacterized protein YggU (UPF0235/DUF167 family)